ncbi:MAG: hypothetical protein WHV26_11830 [Spirochaetota bacterium]
MKIRLYITIVLLLLYIFAGCNRLNIYDLSSGKSRTAYALIQEGSTYTLAIVNTQFVKLYKTNLPSLGTPGIAVNDKRILVYDKSSSNPSYTNTDNLNEWIVYNTDTTNNINETSEQKSKQKNLVIL